MQDYVDFMKAVVMNKTKVCRDEQENDTQGNRKSRHNQKFRDYVQHIPKKLEDIGPKRGEYSWSANDRRCRDLKRV